MNLLTMFMLLTALPFLTLARDSCQHYAEDLARAKLMLANKDNALEYISLRPSSRLKLAVYVPKQRLRYHESIVLLRTVEGNLSGFTNVPRQTFLAWAWAPSPASYYQEKIRSYASDCSPGE